MTVDGSRPTRRQLLSALSLAALQPSAFARDTPMREALDLRGLHKGVTVPVVLIFSIKGCPFCEFVRRSYLLPMTREGIMSASQVSLDRVGTLVAFDGSVAAPRAWAKSIGVNQTPTVLIVNEGGKVLAQPLVGVVSSEYYGAMLDARLNEARAAGIVQPSVR